jgi:hypothetical protein
MSTILLTPVWMLGLSLLYVDERVRHEGYDIELMASRHLGEIPVLAGGQVAPIVPALAVPSSRPVIEYHPRGVGPPPLVRRNPNSTLGLN